jgi:hypothetical protein
VWRSFRAGAVSAPPARESLGTPSGGRRMGTTCGKGKPKWGVSPKPLKSRKNQC